MYCTVRRRLSCLKYLVVTQVTNTGHLISLLIMYTTIFTIILVTDNLPWWFQCGRMGRSAVAMEEKLGVRYADRFAALIDCNCLRTGRPGGGPQGDGPGFEMW